MNNDKNPFDTYHVAPVTYDDKGRPIVDAPFTSTQDTKRHAVVVPPEKVIPVILVPGIMGSNLRLKKLPDGFANKRYTTGVKPNPFAFPPVERQTTGWGDMAWRPDNTASFMVRRLWALEAYERRRLLDPANTEIDDRGEIPADLLSGFVFDSPHDMRHPRGEERKRGFINEMKRRGWGTVMLGCYGPLLAYLEKNLNSMYYRGQLNQFWQDNIVARRHGHATGRGRVSYTSSDWGIRKGDKPLTVDDVKKAARYWFPVHAVGYNWIKSNRDSCKHLADKINEFTAHYRSLGYACEKVILVTHSMGGLVARAAVHANIGGAAARVVGVIHGVMPTHGAAAAYRRCHAGFEGGGYTSKSGIASKMLGEDGPEVAAVFSNSPGALQLLPSKLYGMGWLEVPGGQGKPHRLPVADPYTEIYEQKDAWWRLMNPAWVDPVPKADAKSRNEAWTLFLRNLKKAKEFHEAVGPSHHANTHVQYGADAEDHRAYGSLKWMARNGSGGFSGDSFGSRQCTESKDGDVTAHDVLARQGRTMAPAQFKLSNQDEAGDGTVPRRSAAALNGTVGLVAEHTGYDHQNSYKDIRVQELTAYGVVRFVAENMP